MLPINLLNALKAYTAAQKPPLPVGADDTPTQNNAVQFSIGQKVQGIVQNQVAANIYRVNVGGQIIQMNLPAALNNGQSVTLKVTALQPKLTFAMADSANPLATPDELGTTAKLLSSLSQQSPQKAYVSAARSAPLWEVEGPPQSTQLAGMLRGALSNSGLFYESHQAQWLAGSRSTAQLLGEPQNQPPGQPQTTEKPGVPAPQGTTAPSTNAPASPANAPAQPAVAQAAARPTAAPQENLPAQPQENLPGAMPPSPAQETPAQATLPHAAAQPEPLANVAAAENALPQTAAESAPPAQNASGNAAASPAASSAAPHQASPAGTNNAAPPQAAKPAIAQYQDTQSLSAPAGGTNAGHAPAAAQAQGLGLNIPDHLQTLVRQQLNALETGQIIWRGDVWPGQDMQWEVHEQQARTPAEAGQRQWVTQIYLHLPNLGEVSATLRLNSAGVGMTLNASNPQTRTTMSSASTELVAALSDAGIPVAGLPVVDAKVPQP